MTILGYGQSILLFLCVVFVVVVLSNKIKSLSVCLVSLPLEDVDFYDNCRLLSEKNCFVCLLVL